MLTCGKAYQTNLSFLTWRRWILAAEPFLVYRKPVKRVREKDILPVVLTSLVCLCLAWFFRTSRVACNTSVGLESFRLSGRWRNENARVGDKSARGLGTDIDKHK